MGLTAVLLTAFAEVPSRARHRNLHRAGELANSLVDEAAGPGARVHESGANLGFSGHDQEDRKDNRRLKRYDTKVVYVKTIVREALDVRYEPHPSASRDLSR
jgi:hypothetical protein